MSVQAYVEWKEYLARFYSQVVTKEWRCRKFEGGLKHQLRRFIVPLRVREFPVWVEQAKSVEQLEMGPTRSVDPKRPTMRADNIRSPIVDRNHPRKNYGAIFVEEST